MKILHWLKPEASGLGRSTIELANWEEKAGHTVAIRQPMDDSPVSGVNIDVPDVHSIHTQLGSRAFFDNRPKLMWMHGEPLSSVANGVSMKAIVDLASKVDGLICMRTDEYPIWSAIKRTHLVRKGIDLDMYTPLEGVTERLEGEPAILYYENWREQRNPLYLMVAMQEVLKELPKARLHLYNCNNQKMMDTFAALIKHNKWWTFCRTLKGQTPEVNLLLNRVDIVVSCLFPLYARSIEAFGAGKAFIGPGYKEHDYPYQCTLDPHSMAQAIIKCWKEYGTLDFRQWARDHHNIADTVAESVGIYERYL